MLLNLWVSDQEKSHDYWNYKMSLTQTQKIVPGKFKWISLVQHKLHFIEVYDGRKKMCLYI